MFVGTPEYTAALPSQHIAGRLRFKKTRRVALNFCPTQRTERAATKQSAGPQLQATGGARDRKASRGGSAIGVAVLKQSSTRRKFTGTSSGGGAGANAVEARKIDAQIAQ
jgi:hypothetical protein